MSSIRFRLSVPVGALVILAAAAGCESKKSSNPLSPTVAGPIPGVEISAPRLLEPAQGWKLKPNQQPITLLIENSWTTGVRPLKYQFEVAVDAGFQTKVFSKGDVAPGSGGRTSLRLSSNLQVGRTYYWRAHGYDGANTGPMASTVSFDIQQPAVLNPPALLSPINGQLLANKRPQLIIQNSTRSGPIGNVSYQIQVSLNPSFSHNVSDVRQPENGSGQTSWTAGGDYVAGSTFYWRVYATDGGTQSAWSGTQTFKTPADVPVPTPGPGPTPGGPCSGPTPLSIVQCRRAQYGTPMSASQIVALLKGVASDLNAGGFPDRPYGILRKTGGTNCNGYSCDIICSGSGTSQKQWDILGNADPGSGTQTPAWNGPATYPNIRIDTCYVQ